MRDSSFSLLIDSQLNMVSQRRFSLADDVHLPGAHFQINSVPALKDNNDMFLIFHKKSADPGFINIVNLPAGYNDLLCRGEESSHITTTMPGYSELPPPAIQELPPLEVDINPYNDLNVYDDNVQENKFCVQQSVCDTVRIVDMANACMVGDTASFALVKNPLCLRKTIWQTDTGKIKIITISDTSIRYQYLIPYSGYIRVSFENSELSDSFFVDIQARLQPFDIGNDTVLCPGESYTIRATSGYKNYLWSNGVKTDSLTVTRPGIYQVSAEDFCGGKYYGTINISAPPRKFAIGRVGEICPFDTATVSIDPFFKKYKWEPADKALLHNTKLSLFPDVTTRYLITAEAFPGCIVRDSIKVTVADCPTELFFPNAFSPNFDGLNDEFRPSVTGKLKQYRLTIYNRYGQIVFQSFNEAKGWDGRFRSEHSPVGMYVWVCEYRFQGSSPKQVKGTVALMR